MKPARRHLLKRSLGLSVLWAAQASAQTSTEPAQSWQQSEGAQSSAPDSISDDPVSNVGYLAPYQRGPDHSGVAFLDQDGFLLTELKLPGRAHGVTADPFHRWGCVFARRPGEYFVVIDLKQQRIVRQIQASPGRHFYGHGTFSADGTHLFATENDYDAQHGVVGIFDVARGFQRTGEFRSGGIGPHDIIRLTRDNSLLVANGGIATHPETGRDKLNLDTMRPSVSVLNARTGQSSGDFLLPESLHQVSLRHLACDPKGVCWIAGQQQSLTNSDSTGSKDNSHPPVWTNTLPLLARLDLARPIARLEIIELPSSVVDSLQGYISSIAANGNTVMLTSARGGVALSIDRRTGKLMETVSLFDCSGVAAAREPNTFIITSGRGEWVYSDNRHQHSPVGLSVNQWDNHLGQV